MVGLTGCAADRYYQSTDQRVEDSRTAERVREALAAAPEYKFGGVQATAFKGVVQLSGFVNTSDQSMDPRMEDSRTAEHVREALAAGIDYRYDGVMVIASNAVVQLSGFVNTIAQRNSAGEVTSKVVGVKSVVNNLTLKE